MSSSPLSATPYVAPQRRLSLWRLMLAVILLAALSYGGYVAFNRWRTAYADQQSITPWFASYVDVTAAPQYGFEALGSTAAHDALLSFIVASPTDACTPSWGAAYTMNQAADSLDLDRRIARLQQEGGNIAVSFGGLTNQELATACSDQASLLSAYKSVVARYKLNTIDLDIEGKNLSDSATNGRRAETIAKLQADQRANGSSLAVWLTLPVTTQGLDQAGTDAVAQFLAKGVDLAGVNVMTMDYGASRANGQTMAQASEVALIQTERQLDILYRQHGVALDSTALWLKLGATPMIGQNDNVGEVFGTDDAEKFNSFATSRGIGRMSMWSANRDVSCGSNYTDLSIVSDACSGVSQNNHDFMNILRRGFNGSFTHSANHTTQSNTTSAKPAPDDPATSPYQIWSQTGTYLQGTKVVWHHNVYVAKWWTQGDLPDNPVLQAWQTPWELVGPVLAGEKPIPQATLPAGTYPDWSGTSTYDAGQRVLFQGVPYQAKWWNQGDSPAATASNPNGSPWIPLTQSQINDIVNHR